MNLPTTQPAAMVVEVSKSFGDRAVLSELDLTLAQGEFVALLGASGSGKTTLLRILAGLEVASAGEVLVPEVRTVVYQEPRLVASMRVWRNVVIGLPRSRATRARAVDALTRLRMQTLVAELCSRHHPGVLLVTHDVEEAILLADRVLVLTDSRISLDRTVDLPRPRRVGGEAFDELRDRLLAQLGVLAGQR